jgi:ribosomal protein S18 acetylase RimI-like enzyme
MPPEPPEGVTIRRASAADLPRILEIEADSYGPFSDGPEVTSARFEAAPWSGVLVEDGEVIAYAINAAVEGNIGRTLSLGVGPEVRGRQLGSTMLQAAAYQLAATGARRLAAVARPDVPGSIDAARRLGYRPGSSGTEFRRSLDERANKERRDQRHIQGMKVRFGEWR